MPGRMAGSPIAVYAQVQCREPKTGQQKVQLQCEDNYHCQSGYIIYLWGKATGQLVPRGSSCKYYCTSNKANLRNTKLSQPFLGILYVLSHRS